MSFGAADWNENIFSDESMVSTHRKIAYIRANIHVIQLNIPTYHYWFEKQLEMMAM